MAFITFQIAVMNSLIEVAIKNGRDRTHLWRREVRHPVRFEHRYLFRCFLPLSKAITIMFRVIETVLVLIADWT